MLRRTIAIVGIAGLVGAALYSGGSAAGAGKPRGLSATVRDVNGADVGTVRLVPQADGKVRVTARLAGLTPGFHGFHIHSVGTCDPVVSDTNAVPFGSAGGHFNPAAVDHGAHAGDLPPVLATADGRALLRLKTDGFLNRDLMDADGSAVILHAAPDNLAHVPGSAPNAGERYHSHVDDVFGPDTATRSTGDAGSRFGCGVISKAS